MIALVLESPTTYLHELCGMLHEATGVCVSEAGSCNVMDLLESSPSGATEKSAETSRIYGKSAILSTRSARVCQ